MIVCIRSLTGILIPLVLLCGICFSQCPLGYTLDESCSSEDPGCALFTDSDSDGLCDNTLPAEAEEPDAVEEEQPETPVEEDVDPPPAEDPEPPIVEPETEPEPEDSPVPEPVEIQEDPPSLPEPETEELPEDVHPEPLVDESVDSASLQERPPPVVDEPEPPLPAGCCPLGYTPVEACFEDSWDCTLYTDLDGDGRCDNPGPQPDSSGTGASVSPDTTARGYACPLVGGSSSTCPLDLPPEAACPDSLALCPHWYGIGPGVECANPMGGQRRNIIILVALAVLLVLSTVISRKLPGLSEADKRRRRNARCAIHSVSLMILGFVVQGCYCPLGSFQFLFVRGGVAFIGLIGLGILVLPVVFSIFFGRVFCGWICPMGGVQDAVHRIPFPWRKRIPARVNRRLGIVKYLMLAAIVALPLLSPDRPVFGNWPALFCAVDPFRTIFTFFLSGSILVATILIVLALFFNRFFCRYLCFYGALLTICTKTGLLRRMTGRRLARKLEEEVVKEEQEAKGEVEVAD